MHNSNSRPGTTTTTHAQKLQDDEAGLCQPGQVQATAASSYLAHVNGCVEPHHAESYEDVGYEMKVCALWAALDPQRTCARQGRQCIDTKVAENLQAQCNYCQSGTLRLCIQFLSW
jgi:hypothetical protein